MKARYALLVYFALVIAYVGYACYSYTGLYRLAAEWQMQAFGSYESRLTFFAPVLVLMLPVALIERILGLPLGRIPARAVSGPSRESGPARASGPSRASGASRLPAIIALIGIAALTLSAGVALLGYRQSLQLNFATFEMVDLANNATPASTHVVMTAIAQTEYIQKLEITVGGTTRVDTYIPLTSVKWRRGDPFVYFLKTNATVYLPPGESRPLAYARQTPAFLMTTQPATLMRGALPGPIAEGYRSRGVALSASAQVLDLDSQPDVQPYFVVMGLAGLIGLCCLVTAGIAAFQRRTHLRV